MRAILIFALSFLAAFSSASCDFFDIIRHDDRMVNTACKSWRLNAEIGNLVNWTVIPASCENYVGDYMVGGQYTSDVELLAEEALTYAKNLILKGDGKDAWIFDIDDTALSHVTYYSSNHFGYVFFALNTGRFSVLNDIRKILDICYIFCIRTPFRTTIPTTEGYNSAKITIMDGYLMFVLVTPRR